jgi:hypothetical protein
VLVFFILRSATIRRSHTASFDEFLIRFLLLSTFLHLCRKLPTCLEPASSPQKPAFSIHRSSFRLLLLEAPRWRKMALSKVLRTTSSSLPSIPTPHSTWDKLLCFSTTSMMRKSDERIAPLLQQVNGNFKKSSLHRATFWLLNPPLIPPSSVKRKPHGMRPSQTKPSRSSTNLWRRCKSRWMPSRTFWPKPLRRTEPFSLTRPCSCRRRLMKASCSRLIVSNSSRLRMSKARTLPSALRRTPF